MVTTASRSFYVSPIGSFLESRVRFPAVIFFPLINPGLSSNPLFVYMAVDELSVEFVEAPEEFVPLVIIVMSLE